jgi:hypothetical protein
VLLVRANCVERATTPSIVIGDPIRGDLPVVHHRRIQEARLRERHLNVERLDFLA